MSKILDKKMILKLFRHLDAELKRDDIIGEVFMVGGAVMCLVMGAREATADVDALFRPASAVRKAAARVAVEQHVPTAWLNDAVKGYLSEAGDFSVYLELDNLRVMAAEPETLLAMKCLAMRIGQQFHDLEDVRFLLRALNIGTIEKACEVIEKYYSISRFPQKTMYILQEILDAK